MTKDRNVDDKPLSAPTESDALRKLLPAIPTKDPAKAFREAKRARAETISSKNGYEYDGPVIIIPIRIYKKLSEFEYSYPKVGVSFAEQIKEIDTLCKKLTDEINKFPADAKTLDGLTKDNALIEITQVKTALHETCIRENKSTGPKPKF